MARKPKTNLAPPDPLARLTDIQRRYVEARVNGMGITAAARAAGVANAHGNAQSLEHNPAVKLALQEINKQALAGLVITRHDVIEGLLQATRAAATATELVMAWREIGKIIGAYEPVKVAITHEMLLPEQLAVMSDRELMMAANIQGVTLDDAEYEVLNDTNADPD